MILVTGANGLLGSYLVRQLIDNGESVRGLRRAKSDLTLLGDYANRMEWIEGDVTDIFSLEEGMKGIDKVYHGAALISMQSGDADKMLNINAEGTANVVNAALGSDIKKLLYVSSVAAFGRPENPGRVIDENLDVKDSKDNFAYFKSKLYAEREVWRGIAEGLNAVIICPSTILGGGFWSMPPNAVFAQLYKGLPFYTSGINGFVDVRDVVSVAIRLMDSDISSEKFIVSAANLSWSEVMWMAADAMKVRRPSIRVSKSLSSIAWRLDAMKSLFSGTLPIATRDSVTLAQNDFRYSNEKVRKALNFTFRPLQDTIAETAATYINSMRDKRDYGLLD
jgi:nucleoside-diphosphate-sugar epimerase